MLECSDTTPEIIQYTNLNYVYVNVFSYSGDPALHRAELRVTPSFRHTATTNATQHNPTVNSR
jgi:hypothetical protein